MPRFTHRKVIPIGATARVVVAQRAPEKLTLVRHRTQSTAETIARLSVTAVLAYLAAACDQQDRVLTGPPCPAGTVGSPGRGGAPGFGSGRSWQRGTAAGTR